MLLPIIENRSLLYHIYILNIETSFNECPYGENGHFPIEVVIVLIKT